MIQSFEHRTLLSVSSVFDASNGALTVSTNAGDAVTVDVDGTGQVQINSADPDTGAVAASGVQSIRVVGDDGANSFDLRGVSAEEFSSLVSIVVDARNGNDTVYGSGFDELLLGRRGHDLLVSGAGDDTVKGHGGRDTLIGGLGDDMLRGGGGRDSLSGGAGRDTLSGQGGDDTLRGDAAEDKLSPGTGDNVVLPDAAQVTTDRADYQPGDTVLIDAAGFQQGEAVEFQVLHTDGTPNTGDGHEPWSVTDGGAGDLDGVADGNIQTTWFVHPDDSLNSEFELTAVGLTSGESAATTFTDSQARHEHWRNVTGQWSTGNINGSNSNYPEGATIPDRYEVTGLDPDADDDNVLRLDVVYDYFRDSTYTFDFLTTYNRTESVDAFLGSQTTLTTASSLVLLEVPDDPTHNFDNVLRNAEGAQYFTIYHDGSFLNASIEGGPTLSNGSAYQKTIDVRVETDASQFAVFWGGHSSLSFQWSAVDVDPEGNTKEVEGSGVVSGAPFHMRVEGLVDEDDDGERDSGETTLTTGDRSVQSGAVFVPNVDIDVQKTADPTSVETAGQSITYGYRVENTGDVVLMGVTLIDDVEGTLTLTDTAGNGVDVLEPGDIETATSVHMVTQAEFDAGSLKNIATATGVGLGVIEVSDTDMQTVAFLHDPAIKIVKDADPTTVSAAGEQVEYTYTVANEGDVTLTGVAVTDDNGTPGDTGDDFQPTYVDGDDNGNNKLDVGETWTYTAMVTITQDQIDALSDIVNTATAESDQEASDSDTATVTIDAVPSLAIEKSADRSGVSHAGEVVTYTYTVENTCNVTLTGVVVADDNGTPGDTGDDFQPTYVSGDTNGNNKLDVGETWTYTAAVTITQEQIDALSDIVNTATAESDQGAGDNDTETVTIDAEPSLAIDKSADRSGVSHAGEVVTYTYTVENTCNVTLTGVMVTDDNGTPGDTSDDFQPTYVSGDTNGNNKLDVGETWTYTAMVAITQDQIDALSDIVNTATAESDQDASDSDTATVTVDAEPSIEIEKSADRSGVSSAGEVVTYTYTVENTCNVTLTGITVTDDNGTPGDTGDDFHPTYVSGDTNGNNKLDVGETWTYTAAVTIAQAQIDALSDIVNTATADTDQGAGDNDTATVTIDAEPSLAIEKSADRSSVSGAGEVVTYTYTVENTCNVTLTGVMVTDDNGTPGDTGDDFHPTYVAGDTNGNGKLDVGETWTYTAMVTITQEQIDAGGEIVNTATAESDQEAGGSDTASVEVLQDPAIRLVKEADVESVARASDEIVYTYTVTNQGNVTLTGVELTDDNATPADTSDDFHPTYIGGDTNNDGKLDVDETWVYRTTVVATQAQIDAEADIVNTAIVDSDQSEPDSDTATVEIQRELCEVLLEDFGYGTAGLILDPRVEDGVTMALFVNGTPNSDDVAIEQSADGRVRVDLDGSSLGVFDFSIDGTIYVCVFEGNDRVLINANVTRSTLVFGDAGNDSIRGGSGDDVLVGDEGEDFLFGGEDGRDILIGGTGADFLEGHDPNSRETKPETSDLLIADQTPYQEETDRLFAMFDIWNMDDDYEVRVASLRDGPLDLENNVHDDGELDRLSGGRGRDYFLLNTLQDVSDQRSAEFAN